MSNRQNTGIADLDVLAGASVAQSDKVRVLDVSAGQEVAVTIAGLAVPLATAIEGAILIDQAAADAAYLPIHGKADTAGAADSATTATSSNAVAPVAFTAPTELAGADVASGDLLIVDDISAAATKKVTVASLATGIGAAATQAKLNALLVYLDLDPAVLVDDDGFYLTVGDLDLVLA